MVWSFRETIPGGMVFLVRVKIGGFFMLKKVFYSALALSPALMFAEGELTLPEVGQSSIAEYITMGVTALASVLGVCVAAYVSFLVVRKALKFFKIV